MGRRVSETSLRPDSFEGESRNRERDGPLVPTFPLSKVTGSVVPPSKFRGLEPIRPG